VYVVDRRALAQAAALVLPVARRLEACADKFRRTGDQVRVVRQTERQPANRRRKVTEWISVNDKLPNRDGFYLVLENVNQVAGYYHWCREFGWNTDGGRINIQTVTHWMPLPTPPEVRNDRA